MDINDFDEFFREIHGYSPFPWQKRLLKETVNSGWPDTISLPTASGKTSVIDIALFSMALEASEAAFPLGVPRRIFFTVDRRFVVDEAYETSVTIKKSLIKALDKPGIVGETARKLLLIAGKGSSTPVEIVRLHGGIPHEHVFIRNPLQPTIILSTVDQVGSRLLFRGYGVSEFMRPVHAALIGKDSLIIVDEAHLSGPFAETLEMVRKYQGEKWGAASIGNNVTVVTMTATPSVKGKNTFFLDQEDWGNDILSKRFGCRKPVRIITAKITGKEAGNTPKDLALRQFSETFTDEAKSIMSRIKIVGNPVVGVVVNTVALANIIYDQLSHEGDADTVKIIGRIRPFERDRLLEEFLPRMEAGRKDDANPAPLYVVATQTVEVGANIDFDALITEDASLDALRQRFGRLNRMGTRSEAPSVIIHSSFRKESNELIYGESWSETWKWLEKTQKEKQLDFGVYAMEKLLQGTDISKLLAPKPPAPLLMPSHFDMLVQTSPSPAIQPEISWLLHGTKTSLADVQVIWRGDLPESLGDDAADAIVDCISLMPPTSYEAVSVPVWVLKSMLNKVPHDFSDVEGQKWLVTRNEDNENGHASPVFLWLGGEKGRIVGADEINPGETIILPVSYGGYDKYGWNPASALPVRDIAEISTLKNRRKKVMRIHPAFMASWFGATDDESLDQCKGILAETLASFNEGGDLHELVDSALNRIIAISGINSEIADSLVQWVNIGKKRLERVYPLPKLKGIFLEERQRTREDFTDEDDESSYTQQVTLEAHCKGVESMARFYAERSGLPSAVCDSIAAAGLMHDLGKADPRFQSWLRGGVMSTGSDDVLLAKSSGSGIMDFGAIQRARMMSGYPKGGRHECYSVAIVKENPELLSAIKEDTDLVIYLIGSHHGRGRAMMPAVTDEGMETAFTFMGSRVNFHGMHGLDSIDSGWPDLFWKLVRKYGYWGLSYLETMVRLGDHTESAMEVENGRIQ